MSDNDEMFELLAEMLDNRKAKLPENIRGLLEKVHTNPADQWRWMDTYEEELKGDTDNE